MMNERPNLRFSNDILAHFIKNNELPVIDPLSGERKLPGIDPSWVKVLGEALVKSIVFTNFNGNEEQASRIAQDFTELIHGKKMAYGFTSLPDNRTPGKSDSIMALKGKLGEVKRFPGTNNIIEIGHGHRDTNIVKDDLNEKNTHLAVVIARAASETKKGMDRTLSEQEKRGLYLGNLVLMNDDEMADLVGASKDDVTGGSAYILTGFNPDYGTLRWEQLTHGMQLGNDPHPHDLDK